MGARETFAQAALAARRLQSVAAELAALGESWRYGGEWLCCGRRGNSDPTASAATYRMGKGSALESELAALRATVAEAEALARGVAELLGAGYADALRYRYLENRPWAEVSALMGVCESTARNRVSTALDTIDGLGRVRVLEAHGMAEDR